MSFLRDLGFSSSPVWSSEWRWSFLFCSVWHCHCGKGDDSSFPQVSLACCNMQIWLWRPSGAAHLLQCSVESCSCDSSLYQFFLGCIVWWTMRKTELPPFQAGCKHQHLFHGVNFCRWINSTLRSASCQPPESPGAVGQEPMIYMDVFQPDVSAGIFWDCSEILVALLVLKELLYGATGGTWLWPDKWLRGKSVVLGEETLVWELQPFLQNQKVILCVSESTLL